jgi:hypothetical protein
MAWNPSLAVTGIEKIVDNLRAEVISKQVDALAWASPDPNNPLTPFTIFYRSYIGHFLKTRPHLYIVRITPRFQQRDDDVFVTLQLLIEGEIEAVGVAVDTAESMAADVVAYWVAIDSIIRNVSSETLLAGVETADKAQVKVNDWDVIPFESSPIDTDGNSSASFINAPNMTVEIQYYERILG